jgi:short-subunit dehydrogenase
MPSTSSSAARAASSRLRDRYPGWALVTGGSSGIGQGFVTALAREGFDVALVARGADRLRAAAERIAANYGVHTRAIVADLAAPGAARSVVDAVADIEIGVLVNNAGSGWIGRFDKQTSQDHARLVSLHCSAPVELTSLLLPGMEARKRGAIVLVSSIGGYVPLPYYAVYSGTKAFLALWGEALREELRASGVDVLVVAPGDTKTNFQSVAGEMSTRWMSVDDVVAESLAGLGRKAVVVPGFGEKATLWLTRFLPRRVLMRVIEARQRSQTPPERR